MSIWKERVDEVLKDERKAKIAALLYFHIENHLKNCSHKRACPESILMDEAKLALNHVTAEESTWGDGSPR